VLAAVADSQKIQSDLIPGIATAFCSGYAETGGTCGALNGAVLALSMIYGRRTNQDSRELVYAKTRQLVDAFEERFLATICPDLLQIKLGTPDASMEYQVRGLHKQCENYIRQITQVAVTLLEGE